MSFLKIKFKLKKKSKELRKRATKKERRAKVSFNKGQVNHNDQKLKRAKYKTFCAAMWFQIFVLSISLWIRDSPGLGTRV